MPAIIESRKDGLTLSTDPKCLDIEAICYFLAQSYWAGTRSRATIELSLKNSLVFAVYERDRQVAMARVVSDYSTFAWLCDVFVHPDYRSRGICKWMMENILAHPDLQGLRRWILASTTAQGLYAQFGFSQLQHPERWMEHFNPDARHLRSPANQSWLSMVWFIDYAKNCVLPGMNPEGLLDQRISLIILTLGYAGFVYKDAVRKQG